MSVVVLPWTFPLSVGGKRPGGQKTWGAKDLGGKRPGGQKVRGQKTGGQKPGGQKSCHRVVEFHKSIENILQTLVPI